MTKQEIEEGNILISEFVGPSQKWNDSKKGPIKLYRSGLYSQSANCEAHELKFHCSWDWIMPVAIKISKDFDFSLSSVGLWACAVSRKNCDWEDKHLGDMGGHEPDVITNVFLAIVQFLKWYNKQPKYKNEHGN